MGVGNWDKYGLALARSMSDIEFYDAVLRKLFKGFYPGFWSKVVEDKFETLQLFMRHYAFDIKKYTIEDLQVIEIAKFYRDAGLSQTCTRYFQGKYTLFFLKSFPELNVLKLRQVPKNFWKDPDNIIYAIKHLVELEYEFSHEDICKNFTKRFIAEAGYSRLLQLGYNAYDLLELCYPNRFKLEDLRICRCYSNVYLRVSECLKLFLAYMHLIDMSVFNCTAHLIHETFEKLYGKITNLNLNHNTTFNELKEYAIQYQNEHEIDEGILNLISDEEANEIKRKYKEYVHK